MRSALPLIKPRSRSARSSTFAPALNVSSWLTLISATTSRKIFLKPRFGRRRASGVWPPSKEGLNVARRAYWPFWPRPAVLPSPEPTPRPLRILSRVVPSGFASLLSVSAIVHLLHGHEVEHFLH